MKTKAEFLEYIMGLNPNYNIELIERAYKIAEKMHAGQLRKSGEPYIIHPVAAAEILAELGMDDDTIAAGLLHDVVEDTEYSKEQLVKDFGEEVALLVDGVTKLGSIKFESKEERQAENLRKMFLAMSKDIRVLIIKLSDRLHNLRTIDFMKEEKIIGKSNETLEIYAPLAIEIIPLPDPEAGEARRQEHDDDQDGDLVDLPVHVCSSSASKIGRASCRERV